MEIQDQEFQTFKPTRKLRTKYISYVIIAVLGFWLIEAGPTILIWAIDSEISAQKLLSLSIIPAIISIVILGIAFTFIHYYYRNIFYEILNDEVHVYRGLITRTRKIVPYRTITNIDVKMGPLDRFYHIGTIEIQTAGNSARKRGPEERIDGVPASELESIQKLLINKVRKVRGSAGTSHDPDDEGSILIQILQEIKQLRLQLSN